ncbi:FtsX-like permease family protein [Cellulomonas fengjieae]|uniref:ABC3 transporter permease C-terminal domain-containing protein n=1 Tax=Cellulomonas fengjieae TaxID=2819978 RepID=A0ABS3SLF7_9CELL|nr:FtsX-like permease family protein [Cellulomonas fengjieae]MBO3086492.1 hypothetical protein [Cellulomonas fengjieae]QVI66645.1 hypothetical protein KG102_03335 [Cellulomonas fengjieae]
MSAPTLRRPPRVGWRAATGDAVLVARRRGAQDAGLLTLAAVVLAVAVLIALAVPRLVQEMADEGVRQSIVDAGPGADVVAVLPRGPGSSSARLADPVRVDDAAVLAANAARDMGTVLPPEVQAVTAPAVYSVRSQDVSATIRPGDGGDTIVLGTRLVHVGTTWRTDDPVVRWVAGAEPAPTASAPLEVTSLVQVGVSAPAAARHGLVVGQRLDLSGTLPQGVQVEISGLYEPLDPASPVWSQYPDLLDETPAPAAAVAVGRVAMLLSDESLPDMLLAVQQTRGVTTTYRFPADPTHLTAPDVGALAEAVSQVVLVPTPLTGTDGTPPAIQTELDTVLRIAQERMVAASAQTSVLLVGLGVVGALALVLAARLLVVRRETFLVAERARGASIASVAVRSLVETVPLVVAAAAVGAAGAWLIAPDGRGTWVVAAIIVVVAALAPAVAACVVVAGAWTGRRQPANRADRERALRRRGARRVTAELTLVAIAAAALVSVRSRGLLQTATGDVDLLLAATPVLLAAAATVLLARILPPTLRAMSHGASRRRGLVPVIATARASLTSGIRVPLLTLTISVALVVFCGTTADTVQQGQETAADIVVGADVRVDGPVDPADVARLRDLPGVTSAAAATALGDRTFGQESGTKARLLLVDAAELATILEAHDRPVDPGLATLGTGEGIPVLISASLRRTAELVQPAVMGASRFVDLDVVGATEHPPNLPRDPRALPSAPADGTIVADRDTFLAGAGIEAPITTLWVDGPGALAAVREAGLADSPGLMVTERSDWLETWRASSLNAGLLLLLIATGVVLAGYAALALVLTVVATSRERGRTLSALRTLGMDGRTGRAMTFGELAPLALSAVLTGTAIGIAVPWLLTGALGLDLLTGDPAATGLVVTWVPIAGASAVVLVALAAAVMVESAVRRRDRLGEVLRVGER